MKGFPNYRTLKFYHKLANLSTVDIEARKGKYFFAFNSLTFFLFFHAFYLGIKEVHILS